MSQEVINRSSLFDTALTSGKIFIDGAWVAGGGGEVETFEPASGKPLATVGSADTNDVARAAASAARAQKEWAAAPPAVRSAVLRRAGQLWEEHAEEVAQWNVREVGAIPPFAQFAIGVTAAECYEAAALPTAPKGSVLASSEDRLSLTEQVPVGVVAVISPFNVPLILGIRAVAPALALGNAVLLKPDPRTIMTGGVSMVRIFEEAGLPPGLLQLLPGGIDVGEAIISDPHVKVVSFTGSTRGGRQVGELAARHLKRSHLELGGNSAFIVRSDADVDQAVNLATWGAYLHQGQICMSIGRHIVHESLFEEYVTKLAAKAEALQVGDPAEGPVHMGPMIDETQRDRVHSVVQQAIAEGAVLRAGGTYDGLFYRPTVLENPPQKGQAFAEEMFGPVATVVPFSDDDEAAAIATDSQYGLSLGIVTQDALGGLELAKRIPTGVVHINDQTVNDEANAPFGGLGDSGTGSRTGGLHAAIESFTETRWITLRNKPATYPL